MQISLAMRIDSCAISLAPSLLCLASARAAARANGPPEPMAHIPSSGSITSPSPDSTNVLFASATTNRASRWRSARSLRHSFASSTADFARFPWCSCNLPSKRSKSDNASAVEPANPASTLSLKRRRIFFAECFITCCPMVTWPSPAITTLLSRRTHNTVVPCIRARDPSVGIRELYRVPEQRADHLFFLLVLAVLLTEALLERFSRKKVRRQIHVIRAAIPEYLVDLPPVQEPGFTKRRLDAVDRMIAGVKGAALRILAGLRI